MNTFEIYIPNLETAFLINECLLVRGDTPSGIFEVLRWLVPLDWFYRQLNIFVLLCLVNPFSFRLPNGHLNWLCHFASL